MKRFLIFVIAVVLVVYGLSRWNERRSPAATPEAFTPASGARVDLKEVEILAAMDREYTRLAEAVMPSVVSLYTARRVRQGADPFEFFFGPRRGRAIPRDFVQNSLGSGVIVSEEGHILTNNHVIADTDEVKVKLRDGREFTARIVGGDPKVDIAVLKIDAPNLVPLPLGDSDIVKVGSLVLAIGNPFGLQETVTHGIISATGRQLSDESSADFFQTDTAINPGNSGGPLINLRGEIIGINTAIGNFSGSGTWQGVGFAIPSNTARRSLESIIKTGRVIHGYLGVVIQSLTPELAQQAGIANGSGALVVDVMPNSPAQKAGVQQGDVIVSFDGQAVVDIRQMLRRVSQVTVGSKVQIDIIRDGKKEHFEALIEERPADFQAAIPRRQLNPQPGHPGHPGQPFGRAPFQQPQPPTATPPPSSGSGTLAEDHPLAGISVAPIPQNRRAELPEKIEGVLITRVDPRYFPNEQLRPGDVIEEIMREPVTNVEEYQRIAQNLPPGQRVLVSICRGKARSFVVLP